MNGPFPDGFFSASPDTESPTSALPGVHVRFSGYLFGEEEEENIVSLKLVSCLTQAPRWLPALSPSFAFRPFFAGWYVAGGTSAGITQSSDVAKPIEQKPA